MPPIQKYSRVIAFSSLLFLSPVTQANPVACFETNLGNFCVELFETQTPGTAANFLNYINDGAYTGGIFHRSVPGFVIQGGGFKLVNDGNGISIAAVETFAPIANEFKITNTRGTLAMAKVAGDPNSATSQWFVNLADNAAILDNQNGGFTVFGRVIFDGMTVVDAIENLPVTNLGGNLSEAPTINFDGEQLLVDNLVRINNVETIDTTGIFSEGILSFAVTTGSGDLLEVKLNLIQTNPEFVFELDPTSVTTLQTNPTNIATFSATNGLLTIPSVMIDPTTVVNNVQMTLTDAQSFQFTLLSFE
jgi:peptidyl-prolyl cis-trans isomerase A (cyclophilin A)